MTKPFLCGYKLTKLDLRQNLTRSEYKTVRNFSKFLRGKGHRCVNCLHKAKRHWTSCEVKGCDCSLDYSGVIATRAQTGAKGWEGDNAQK